MVDFPGYFLFSLSVSISHIKLPGLDGNRLLAVVEPVLKAHRVAGVELIWRTDRGGMVLELTVEKPDSKAPGVGITVDLCSDISRDLSAALDAHDVIPQRYRLEVGSPGVERALYIESDFVRFAGQAAKIKLTELLPLEGPLGKQRVLRGVLFGWNSQGEVELETDQGMVAIPRDKIASARLLFDMQRALGGSPSAAGKKGQKPGAGKSGPRKGGDKPGSERRERAAIADSSPSGAKKNEEGGR